MITRPEYMEAITNLKLAMTQLSPNGNCCHICGDGGHQAWECHFNPLSKAYQITGVGGYWRCFHCNSIFFNSDEAAEHFGARESIQPICKHLCSGYRVFPDGKKCPGCSDCKTG